MDEKEEPLTLSGLVKYNQEVLFPFLEGHFATKEDLGGFVIKKDFDEFKDTSLSKLDEILTKITPIQQEKTMKDLQDTKQKTVLEIHNTALKRENILSKKETLRINNLGAF